MDRVEPQAGEIGGKLLYTSLSKETIAQFQALLDEAHTSA
jgi:hypothetical protein